MGWCGATTIFDAAVGALLKNDDLNVKDIIKKLAKELEDNDWDCQMESDYWGHPIIQEVFKELHPSWFETQNIKIE